MLTAGQSSSQNVAQTLCLHCEILFIPAFVCVCVFYKSAPSGIGIPPILLMAELGLWLVMENTNNIFHIFIICMFFLMPSTVLNLFR